MKTYKLESISRTQTIKETNKEKRTLFLLTTKELLMLKSLCFEDGTTKTRLFKVSLDWNGEILFDECLGKVNDEKGSLITSHDKAFFKFFTK